jgi:putative ABC transport system permease protein
MATACARASSSSRYSRLQKKYDAGTRVLAAGGRPGSTQPALGEADLDTIGAVPGVTGVTPVMRLSPDYIQWNSHDKYQLSVSPLAGAQPQLEAGTGLDDAVAEPQLILPANYVAGLGFSDNNQAIGQDAKIGITDATGAMHPITARVTGIQQSALLGGGGAFINKSLSTALADAQGTGAPAAHRESPHDHSPWSCHRDAMCHDRSPCLAGSEHQVFRGPSAQ